MDEAGPQATRGAVEQAHEVVGLYGDPDTHWGFGLELTFTQPPDLSQAQERLAALVESLPHLGVTPEIERYPDTAWAAERERQSSTPFGGDGQLLRVMVSEDDRMFFIAAHHGVVDGLGTLAVAEALTGVALHSHARGIGDQSSSRGFLTSSLLRLSEALVSPPARFAGSAPADVSNGADHVLVTTLPLRRLGSAKVASAIARAHQLWPLHKGGRRVIISLGASRREPGANRADRQTAYFRVPLEPGAGVEETRRAMAAATPEPDFPETSAGGIGPAVMRLLRNRLGCTVLLSNLGVVTGEHLESGAVVSTLNGPYAVGLGVTSTDSATTVSLRTRRSEFTREETERLLELLLQQMDA